MIVAEIQSVPATAAAPTPSIAGLPMYDWPELQAANDELWDAIAARLRHLGVPSVPDRLTRVLDLDDLWSFPGLLLAQTCGYPLTTRLRGKVQLVATPHCEAPGCEGPFRRSAVVVRANSPAEGLKDLRGARCALNDPTSDSGMNLFRAAVAPLSHAQSFFARTVVTGSHLASASAVAGGDADVAALDAVSFAHLRRHRPKIAGALRVLAWTDRSPGLPLVTGAGSSPTTIQALQAALDAVVQDPALVHVRETLLLKRFSRPPLRLYNLTRAYETQAQAMGYPVLR